MSLTLYSLEFIKLIGCIGSDFHQSQEVSIIISSNIFLFISLSSLLLALLLCIHCYIRWGAENFFSFLNFSSFLFLFLSWDNSIQSPSSWILFSLCLTFYWGLWRFLHYSYCTFLTPKFPSVFKNNVLSLYWYFLCWVIILLVFS